MSRKRRLQAIALPAFLFSLPTIPLIWSSEGSTAGGIFVISLLTMLVCGLLVARRI